MAENALLVERDAPVRSEVRRDARPKLHAVGERDHARDTRREIAHHLRKGVLEPASKLEQRQVGVAQLRAGQPGLVVVGRQDALEIAEILRGALRAEVFGGLGGRSLLSS